jgi:hypothetical protein
MTLSLDEALGPPFGNPGEISVEKSVSQRYMGGKLRRLRPKINWGNFPDRNFEKGLNSHVGIEDNLKGNGKFRFYSS